MSSGLFYTCFIAENVFMIVHVFHLVKNKSSTVATVDYEYHHCICRIVVLYRHTYTSDFYSQIFQQTTQGNADLCGGKCRGISRRNYPFTIRFNAERPWKRILTPGINHACRDQSNAYSFARLQTRLILSWDQARPCLLKDPLFSLNKSPEVYILSRALDGFCRPPAQRGRGGGLKKRKREIEQSLFTSQARPNFILFAQKIKFRPG